MKSAWVPTSVHFLSWHDPSMKLGAIRKSQVAPHCTITRVVIWRSGATVDQGSRFAWPLAIMLDKSVEIDLQNLHRSFVGKHACQGMITDFNLNYDPPLIGMKNNR